MIYYTLLSTQERLSCLIKRHKSGSGGGRGSYEVEAAVGLRWRLWEVKEEVVGVQKACGGQEGLCGS